MDSLRNISALPLLAGVSPATGAQADVDLLYYFVTPGKRESMASLTSIWSGSDTGSLDVKLQESPTSVDSDFTDITNGAFTTITDANNTLATEQIYFALKTGTVKVRAYCTLTNGVAGPTVAANLWNVKRES